MGAVKHCRITKSRKEASGTPGTNGKSPISNNGTNRRSAATRSSGQESGPGGIGWDGRSRDGGLKMAIPAEMGRQVAVVFYVVVMAAVIVGVDLLFFRNRFWERLTVNIGVVLVFVAFYLRFLRRP